MEACDVEASANAGLVQRSNSGAPGRKKPSRRSPRYNSTPASRSPSDRASDIAVASDEGARLDGETCQQCDELPVPMVSPAR